MKQQGLKKGSMILLFATAISKILGVIFKIPLTNLLGGAGMGYFSGAYGVFIPVYIVISAGFPMALTRLVAKNCAERKYKTVRKLRKIATIIFFTMGILGMVIVLLFSKVLAVKVAKNPDCIYSIMAIAPSLAFCCLAEVEKGYYEGMRNMYPTAISQVCEGIAKTVLGLALTVAVFKIGTYQFETTGMVFGRVAYSYDEARRVCLPFAAAGAMLGSTLSEIAGLIAVRIKTRFFGDGISKAELECSPPAERTTRLVKQLLSISIPLLLGAVISAVSSFLDLATIMHGLSLAVERGSDCFSELLSKMSKEEIPNFLYGSYNGLTGTVISFVPIVAGLLSKSALPTVSARSNFQSKWQLRRSIESIMEATLIFSVPAGFGICALSRQILTLLYPSRLMEVSVSATPLAIMGISAVFTSILLPVISMLCAAGKEKEVAWLTVGETVIRLVLNITLIRIPKINITGAAVSSAVTNIVTVLIALKLLYNAIDADLHFRRIFAFTFCFSGVSAALIALTQHWSEKLVGEVKSIIISAFLGVLCYFSLLFVTKVCKYADFKALFPKKHLKKR